MTSHLSRDPRTGMFRVRIRVPKHLHPLIGQRELKQSVQTHDPAEAKSRGAPIIAGFRARLDQAEARWQSQARGDGRIDPEIMTGRFVQSLEVDPFEASPPFEDRSQLMSAFESFAAAHRIVGADLEALRLEVEQADLIPSQHVWRLVRVPRSETERALPLLEVPTEISLSVFRKRYLATKDTSEQFNQGMSRAFDLLDRLVGDIGINQIGPAHARELRDILLAYPVGNKEAGQADAMPIRHVLSGVWKRTISAVTVGKYIGVLRNAWAWAVSEGLATTNVFGDIQVPKVGRATSIQTERLDYRAEHLTKLFGSPLFTSCLDERRLSEPGKVKVRNHMYWLPWLALYTGARLSELTQLERANIKQDGTVWYIELTTYAEEGRKRLKTKTSKRNVPIHRHLIELGFLDYVRSIKSGRLFPAYEDAKTLSKEFSKRYGYYLDRIGITDRSLTFHSFRHNFKSACRLANVPDEIHDGLTGHAAQSVGDTYGRNERQISYLKKQIDLISYSVTPRKRTAQKA